jgi:hypothetical protein
VVRPFCRVRFSKVSGVVAACGTAKMREALLPLRVCPAAGP